MIIFVLVATIVAFILFFYAIGLRYLGFLPILALITLLRYYANIMPEKRHSRTYREQYSIYTARIVILAGLGSMMHFFGTSLPLIALQLAGVNIAGWILSHLINYHDGKKLFQVGYYLTVAFLLMVVGSIYNITTFLDTFSILWVGHLGIVGFIVFIGGIRGKIASYLRYMLFSVAIGTVMIVVTKEIGNIYRAILLNSLLLTGLYIGMYHLLQKQLPSQNVIKQTSLKRILAGERVMHTPTYEFKTDMTKHLYEFVLGIPKVTKYFLEILNVGLVIALIIIYVKNILAGNIDTPQFTYRGIIIVFIANVIILKKIGYTSTLQKIALFAVINFAIYISLRHGFDQQIGSIVGWAIVWNIFSSITLFYAPQWLSHIFRTTDYIHWIAMTVIALVVNVVLLTHTALPGQLLFSLIFLYLGIQGLLLYYGIKHLAKQ